MRRQKWSAWNAACSKRWAFPIHTLIRIERSLQPFPFPDASMNDDPPNSSNGSAGKTWMERLGRMFGTDPRSRDDLLELLREAADSGLIEAETLKMIEGALEV